MACSGLVNGNKLVDLVQEKRSLCAHSVPKVPKVIDASQPKLEHVIEAACGSRKAAENVDRLPRTVRLKRISARAGMRAA